MMLSGSRSSSFSRLEEGGLDEKAGLEDIAEQFELSSRQIRRIVQKELGVPPIQLLLTRRLLLAKQLLTETALPVTEVAFASGFSSLRRFNDAFDKRYGMPPTRLRRKARGRPWPDRRDAQTLTLRLSYRPPYDWAGILRFLAARALSGVEHVTGTSYARTVKLGDAKGWIRVTRVPKADALTVELTSSLTPVLPALLSTREGTVRSQRASRPDREAPAAGRAPEGWRLGESRLARAGCLQRI